MKKAIILSFLSFAVLNAIAQTDAPAVSGNAVCNRIPNMPAHAARVWPKSAYIPIGEPASCPPCYEYKTKHGLVVMECPFLWFPPENEPSAEGAVTAQTEPDGSVEIQGQNTYSGNYPACKKETNMPANAKMVWPASAYIPLGNPTCPPCYEYTRKSGLKVMECPNLWFPPEDKP